MALRYTLLNTSRRGFSSIMPTVDMHSHFLPKSWIDFSKKYGDDEGPWPWMRHAEGSPSKAMLMLGDSEFRPVTIATWDVESRLKDMDKCGVDYQLLCATPILFQYNRKVEQALDVARIFNDLALDMCSKSKGRIFPLSQVPLQDLKAACQEVSRCKSNGHLGVQIGNHVGDRDIGDDFDLIQFLHYCAVEEIPVFVHPWDMMEKNRMGNKYMLGWTVAMPAETQLSITSMIVGGAFDLLPRSLKICFAHGGGSFAFLLGRLENAWHHRDLARGKSLHPPSYYLDRFSVDSAVFDRRSLSLLLDIHGQDRIMLGSDYPFPLGEEVVGKLVRSSYDNNQQVCRKLLGGNAISFFSIPVNKKN